jgi:predicted amidohydrolase YtcJ
VDTDNDGGTTDEGPEPEASTGFSRRKFIAGTAAAGAALGLGGTQALAGGAAPKAPATPKTGPDREFEGLVLTKGKIHTFDGSNRVVEEVLMANGRFLEVGNKVDRHPKYKVVNLKGKTVIPGLIEGHVHVVSLANRPGHHVVIEQATNIAGIQELLAARRPSVPAGEFITAMGGWSTNFFAERRLPTLAELDAAVSDRPVFVYQGGGGPAVTNSLGKAFFESVSDAQAGPVVVSPEGFIATGNPNQANRALYHLRVRQTFEDKKRSVLDAMRYSASVGLTAHLDQVLPPATTPLSPTQGLPNLDHFRMYDAWLAVHREGKTFVRLQMNFLHNQNDINLPELTERLKNSFQLFGDDMFMTGGIGEWGAPVPASETAPSFAAWSKAQDLIAAARWRNENAASSLGALTQVVNAYEAMDATYGIKDLRWRVQHGDTATPELLARLKALGGGISMSGHRWTGTAGAAYRLIVDSGIPHALHQDGVHIAPLNPWFAIYYATTGLNFAGVQTNPGQSITRVEALRAFTRGAAWYMSREDDLGSLEVGKLGDLVVLDRDYLTATDADMRRTRPVLTVVGGNVVYDANVL